MQKYFFDITIYKGSQNFPNFGDLYASQLQFLSNRITRKTEKTWLTGWAQACYFYGVSVGVYSLSYVKNYSVRLYSPMAAMGCCINKPKAGVGRGGLSVDMLTKKTKN